MSEPDSKPPLLMILAPILAPLVTSIIMLLNDERRRSHEKHLAEQMHAHDAKQRDIDRATQINLEALRAKMATPPAEKIE